MNENQLDIRVHGDGAFTMEFPYNEEFIAFIKGRVPSTSRTYDEDTREWHIFEPRFLGFMESVGLQKFAHVMRIFRRGNTLVYRNCRTGVETEQGGLFS